MIKLKIRRGDEVVVITGKDKGKKGKVLKVVPKDNKAVVAGVNVVKRHTKPSKSNNGGIIQKELPIHISNISLVDPKDNKATKVFFKNLDDGSKVRVAKRSGEIISNGV